MLKGNYIYIVLLICLLRHNAYSHNASLHPAPIVDFQVTPFCLGETAYFINTTSGGVFFTWHIFSLNSNNTSIDTIYTSSLFDADFLFPAVGNYTVELIADNGHIVSTQKNIRVDSLITANFDYRPCGSQFNNFSVCYTSCLWDFGDGKTSTLDSPQHYYDVGGNYNVKLTVTKDNKTDTITHLVSGQQNVIDSTFTIKILRDSVLYYMNDTGAIVSSDSILVILHANDTLTGSLTSFHWSFGDGEVADLYGFNGGRTIYHKYPNIDYVFQVFLLIRLPCINSFSTQDLTFYDHPKIQSQNNSIDFNIFPNPVLEGILHITTDRKAELGEVAVLNYLGQPVNSFYSIDRESGIDLDVSNLSSGLYFIRFLIGDELITRKIIKE